MGLVGLHLMARLGLAMIPAYCKMCRDLCTSLLFQTKVEHKVCDVSHNK